MFYSDLHVRTQVILSQVESNNAFSFRSISVGGGLIKQEGISVFY